MARECSDNHLQNHPDLEGGDVKETKAALPQVSKMGGHYCSMSIKILNCTPKSVTVGKRYSRDRSIS